MVGESVFTSTVVSRIFLSHCLTDCNNQTSIATEREIRWRTRVLTNSSVRPYSPDVRTSKMAAPNKKRAVDSKVHQDVSEEDGDFDDQDLMEEGEEEKENMEGQVRTTELSCSFTELKIVGRFQSYRLPYATSAHGTWLRLGGAWGGCHFSPRTDQRQVK